ncbi:hypothetical protein A2U01_0009566 [Trifolium medium]|uniref:Uncharacterized protein n=1 Tax=Trifolium medium TaxID=97028 RepID=A0A392MNJ7_9FABA|nr:hypothetical protein [Trifolium medium]
MLRSEAVLASSASELFVALARDSCALHLWLEKGNGLFEKCCSQLLDIKYRHFEELECFCYVISCCRQGCISQGLVRMLGSEAFSTSRAFELLVTLARDPLVAYHRLE